MPIVKRSRRARKPAQDLHPARQADLKASIIAMVKEGNTPALAAAALSVLPSELAAFREADPNFERELIAVLAQRQIDLHKIHRTGTRDERAAALAELERSHGWIKPGRVDFADQIAPFVKAFYAECKHAETLQLFERLHDRYLAQVGQGAGGML
jgi:hypothetical protein